MIFSRIKNTIVVFIIALFVSFAGSLYSQDITTEGTDFWFGFMENHDVFDIRLEIYISAGTSTQGTVTIPLLDWSEEFTVEVNATTLITVPTDLAMALGSGVIATMGIHVESEDQISVFALNSRDRSADASVILPTPALGRTYYASSYVGTQPSRFSELLIVAAYDGTQVEITPTQATTDGHAAGVPYIVTLNSGELIQVQSDNDLTGTKMQAAQNCLPFAAFSGNEWTNVGGCGMAMDHLYEQMFPVGAWGQEFVTVPYRTRLGGDEFKIVASIDNTVIEITGEPSITLNEGQFATILLDGPTFITADNPIQIAQYSRSESCDNRLGDPFMILLSPIEQSLKKITYNAPNVTAIENYYTNIITTTNSIDELYFDGELISDEFVVFDDNAEYSYTQLLIDRGNHTIESASGFTAYVYGFGEIESFGYATGAKLDNLNMEIAIFNQTQGIFTSQACRGDVLVFSISSKRSFVDFEWDFGDNSTASGDEVSHVFNGGGDYLVSVTGFSASSRTCADQETSVRMVEVLQPEFEIFGPRAVCPFSSGVEYFINDDQDDNIHEWFVDGGSLITGQDSESIIVDWGDTNDQARVRLLSQNGFGCFGDTVNFPVTINIALDPSVPIGLDSLCSSDRFDALYATYSTPTSIYDWGVDNGSLSSENGTDQIVVTWNGPGNGKIWYEESSTFDDVCMGVSDTLFVFIEREPDENLTMNFAKDVYQIEEEISYAFEGDENFNFISWDFGDENALDSVARETGVTHNYSCPGQYEVLLAAYTGTVCQNVALQSREITIIEPQLEIVTVSHHQVFDSTMEIHGAFQYLDFYSGEIDVEKRQIDPSTSDWVKFEMINDNFVLDQQFDTKKEVWDYRLVIDECAVPTISTVHNNLRLEAKVDSENLSKVTLTRNEYKNWQSGVLSYELWRKIDEGDYQLLDEMNGNDLVNLYENEGFDHCFKLKAIEHSGNDAVAWSNEICVAFVPEITMYNVITPNNDPFNEYFIVEGIENYPKSKLTIFNRWGKQVFTSSAYGNDWNGKDENGRQLSTGVYYYVLNLNEPRAEREIINSHVSILR
jgi:gliding motility-associated-like protein